MNNLADLMRLPDEKKIVVMDAIAAYDNNKSGFVSRLEYIILPALLLVMCLVARIFFVENLLNVMSPMSIAIIEWMFNIGFAIGLIGAGFMYIHFSDEYRTNNALIACAKTFGADVSTLDADWAHSQLWGSIKNPEASTALSYKIKPSLKPQAEDSVVLKTLDWMSEVFCVWMGFDAKKHLLMSLHPKVEQGIKFDASETYEEMNSYFFNTLRIAILLFLSLPISTYLLDSYGYQLNIIGRIIFILSSFVGSWLLIRAFQIRFRKAEFEKCPCNDETHAFIQVLNGGKKLREWSIELPELHKFMVTNRIYEEFSTFEFDLVQSYVFAQRRSASKKDVK